jgi:hypothetical protein
MQLHLAGNLFEGRRRHLRIVFPALIEQPFPKTVLFGDDVVAQLTIRMALIDRELN